MSQATPPPDRTESSPDAQDGYRRLPAGVWALGFGSMFMDISSELVHSLLPLFMATVLGASMVTIGLIEGIAEAAASMTKLISGAISDYLRRRKPLLLLGYGLSALSKPLFPLASTITWVFSARFMDRIGKGIRGAPRDALIADLTPSLQRGAAYGLRQALDTVGAVLGPGLALLLMLWLGNHIQAVLWIAVLPALLAVLIFFFAVHEPRPVVDAPHPARRLSLRDAARLSRDYWIVVIMGALFNLARFSEAFLILRAQDLGMSLSHIPSIMIIMNLAYALFAYPAGTAADRHPSRPLLLSGLALLIAADGLLAIASSPLLALLGAALWGLHMACTQGLLAKLVADTASSELRGTAFGVFNLVSGLALLLASLIAGSLWQTQGAPATFLAGAVFAALAAGALMLHRPGRHR